MREPAVLSTGLIPRQIDPRSDREFIAVKFCSYGRLALDVMISQYTDTHKRAVKEYPRVVHVKLPSIS